MSGPWLTDLPMQFLAVTVPCFLIALVFVPSNVPTDVGYLSIIIFGIVLLGLSFSPRVAPYFVRGGLYVGTTHPGGEPRGLLPFDGAMAALDALLHTDPPRVLRPLVARFVRDLPLLRDFYAGIGPVIGTRDNFRQLLERRELVLVFPEGVEGIKKTVPDRYRLQHFHPGFVEESVRLRVPVIPVAIIGPDDQAPILYDVKTIARWLRLPAFPITPTFPWLGPLGLLPYPVRYRIVYGEPLALYEQAPREAAGDRARMDEMAARVRLTVQHLVDRHR